MARHRSATNDWPAALQFQRSPLPRQYRRSAFSITSLPSIDIRPTLSTLS